MIKRAGFLSILLFAVPALADHGGQPRPGQPLVVDVRTEGEYRQGHVREAVNIPYDQIAQRIAAFASDRDARIVLYCLSGRRAGIAGQALRQLSYDRIENKGVLGDRRRAGYRTD